MPKATLMSDQQKTRHIWAKRLSLVPGAILLSPLLLLAGLAWLSYQIAASTKFRLLAIMALSVPLIAVYFTPFLLFLLIPLGIYYLAMLGLSEYIDDKFYNDPDTLLGQFYRYFYSIALFSAITTCLAFGSWLLFGATIVAAYSAIAAFAVTLPFLGMFPPVAAVILLGLAAVASIVMLSYQLYQLANQLYPDPDKATAPPSTPNSITVTPESPSLPPSLPVITSAPQTLLPAAPSASATTAPQPPGASAAASLLPVASVPPAPKGSAASASSATPSSSPELIGASSTASVVSNPDDNGEDFDDNDGTPLLTPQQQAAARSASRPSPSSSHSAHPATGAGTHFGPLHKPAAKPAGANPVLNLRELDELDLSSSTGSLPKNL